MQRLQYETKSIKCICGKCGRVFNSEDARSSPNKRRLYGIEIEEPACPYCGSTGFTPTSLLRWVERYLFI